IQFEHNSSSNATALYYFLATDGFKVGAKDKGNWFLNRNWSTALFLKENITGGNIQSNRFESSSNEMDKCIFINPGSNNILIGGPNLEDGNVFKGANIAAIELRNGCDENIIQNNVFQSNAIAIANDLTLGGVNNGNRYLSNQFLCNDVGIMHTALSNNSIQKPIIQVAKPNFIMGSGIAGNYIEVYQTIDSCTTGDCQGLSIGSDTIGQDGLFYIAIPDSIELSNGNNVSAIQTDFNFDGSSEFASCVEVDSNCVDFVYSCDDDVLGSLRSAIDCATEGDTIVFLNFLSNDSLFIDDSISLDKNITIDGANQNIKLWSNTPAFMFEVMQKTVYIKSICIKSTNGPILRNNGMLLLENS
ncbi:MAG: hypothetical protein AAGK97_17745, partial [Bacteroidota bacterium]